MASDSSDAITYNEFQQVYCLNAAAGIVGGSKGPQSALQKALEIALNKNLPHITGSWHVAWGPAVFKAKPDDSKTGPDNAWYVAADSSQKMCVVATAGTAVTSPYDWIHNAEVFSSVDLDEWTSTWTKSDVPPPNYITSVPGDTRSLCAFGTCDEIHNVLSIPSPVAGPTFNTTIIQFLQTFQTRYPDYRIIFTGHSSGGAVSCAIAQGLVQSKLISNSNISVLPSAAPTPGNASFNAHFTQSFPSTQGSGYQRYNIVFYNTLDIVPQAWSTKKTDDRSLNNILSNIYTVNNTSFKIDITLAGVIGYALGELVKYSPYAPLPGTPFTGPPIPSISTWDQLEDSVKSQHSPAYWQEIGIKQFVDGFTKTVMAQPDVEPLTPEPIAGPGVGEAHAAGIQKWTEYFERQYEATKDQPGGPTLEFPDDQLRS